MACLRTVPVDTSGDVLEIEGLKTLVEFQSDLAYLKNPPPGFLYPGVDVAGSLQAIISDIKNGRYTNEYAVQNDVFGVVASAYDFHFYVRPDIMRVFYWERAESLISVAKDPTSLPNVYGDKDKFALAGNSSGYQPSPVVKINGVDVEQW
jgi:hypothetical protein